ncbi:MAG: hypothetical protein GY856_31190, partial [bacterium]|nr:hypothetical protein [bacterium]
SPPSYLGVVGSSWDDGDVLEELLVDCYSFSLADRVKNLQSQMLEKKRPNIYGLVVRNIRNFLSDRQRRADPIGYRVFRLLQRAISEAVVAGELHILAGDGKIRNHTALGFDPQADPDPPARDFADRVKAWNDELLPELVTARSRTVTEVVGRLRRLVVGLEAAGVDAFRFKDVIDPMKRDVRDRWAGVWSGTVEVAAEPGDGEAPPETVIVAPPIDPIDAVDDLHRCVGRSIDRLQEKPRTREDLWKLWTFVRATHDRDDEAKLPSHLKLGKRLGIYRGRLPRLFEILQRIVEACRSGRQAEPALRS